MTSSFTAHVISGENLKAGDMNGKSDPFVVIYWEGEDASSGVKSKVGPSLLCPRLGVLTADGVVLLLEQLS